MPLYFTVAFFWKLNRGACLFRNSTGPPFFKIQESHCSGTEGRVFSCKKNFFSPYPPSIILNFLKRVLVFFVFDEPSDSKGSQNNLLKFS